MIVWLRLNFSLSYIIKKTTKKIKDMSDELDDFTAELNSGTDNTPQQPPAGGPPGRGPPGGPPGRGGPGGPPPNLTP